MDLAPLFPFGWQHYLAGGLIIGAAVALMFVTTGLVTGMSTVFSSTWSYVSQAAFFQQPRFTGSRRWRLVLATGLVIGAALWWLALGPAGGVQTALPPAQLALGGFIAGYGARMSNGCTSGHGICGLASLQVPSALAVVIFLTTAIATAQLVAAFGGR